MSTPTEPFSNLTLGPPSPDTPTPDSPMAPPATVRARALVIQDIISSFDDTALPTEIEPQTASNIDQNMNNPHALRSRSTEERSVPGNLRATILQWAAYDEQSWQVVSRWATPEQCSLTFHQKIRSRSEDVIASYDTIEESPPNTTTLKKELLDVVDRLRALSAILSKDRDRRQQEGVVLNVEVQNLANMLAILKDVCERADRIAPAGAGKTKSGVELDNSLFGMLIKRAKANDAAFMLGALDKYHGAALRSCTDVLQAIHKLLEDHGAPDAYVELFEALQQKAKEASASTAAMPSQSGPSGRGRGLEADPRPGTKRTQAGPETIPSTPKRGRKAGRD